MSRSLQARLLAVTISLMPVLALAQVADALTPITIRNSAYLSNNTYSFNPTDCAAGNLTLTWTYAGTLGVSFSTAFTLWSTTASTCATTGPAAGDVSYAAVPMLTFVTYKTGTFTVPVATLPAFNVDDGDGGVKVTCGTQGIEVTQKVCGAITPMTSIYQSTGTPTTASELNLVYDTKPPLAPAITDISSLDSSAALSFTFDTGTTTVSSQYSFSGLDAGDVWADGPSVAVANSTKLVLTGLTNDVSYDVRLIAVDQAGNVSQPSAAVQVTPLHTVGFFETLRNDGSTERGGGCAVAGSMMVPLAALGLLRALARRSR